MLHACSTRAVHGSNGACWNSDSTQQKHVNLYLCIPTNRKFERSSWLIPDTQ